MEAPSKSVVSKALRLLGLSVQSFVPLPSLQDGLLGSSS